MVDRRRMLLALGAGALAWPLAAYAQAKLARIGYFYFGSRKSSLDTGRYAAFIDGMRELGYVEGRNFAIEARYADGKTERIPALADEMMRAGVDLIVATGSPIYRVLQQKTSTIPIIVTVTPDPVGAGYAVSLAKPGGNLTGLSDVAADLNPKLFELLRAAVPKLSRLGVLMQTGNVSHPLQMKDILLLAQKSGVQGVLAEAATVAEIDREFALMARERVGAVIILNDTFFVQQLEAIAKFALKYGLPSIYSIHEYAEAGGLMSYGPDIVHNFRRAATYVDKILKGAKPGDLPFEQPTRYFLVINRKSAAALKLNIPPAMLVRADKVIE